MPIYDRPIDGARVAHFGYGDISVSLGSPADEPSAFMQIILTQGEKGEIGRREHCEDRETKTEDGPLIVLHFDAPESIEVLIEELQTLRVQMLPLPPPIAPNPLSLGKYGEDCELTEGI